MIGFSYMCHVLLDLNLQILGGAFHSLSPVTGKKKMPTFVSACQNIGLLPMLAKKKC